jgi:hypothetical protein
VEYDDRDGHLLIHVFEHDVHELLPIKINRDHLLDMGFEKATKFVGERIICFIPELLNKFDDDRENNSKSKSRPTKSKK